MTLSSSAPTSNLLAAGGRGEAPTGVGAVKRGFPIHQPSRMYSAGPHPAYGRKDHACLGMDVEVFFAPDQVHGRWSPHEARMVCRRCCLLDECRAWAIAAGPELHGVYGATTAKERDAIRAARRAEADGGS